MPTRPPRRDSAAARSRVRASRSSGPGGQHANVTASRIEASVRRRRLDGAHRRAEAAASSPAAARAWSRSPRTPAARRATASSRSSGCAGGSTARSRSRARAAPTRPTAARRAQRRLDAKRRQAERKRARRRPGTDETLVPRAMRWIVDGMNVIGTRPDAWWRDRDAAMLRLVDLLERWAAAEGEDVSVVFERPPSPPIRSTVIEVAHAPRPKRDAADDEIIRRLRADPTAGVGPRRHLRPLAGRPRVGRRRDASRARSRSGRGSSPSELLSASASRLRQSGRWPTNRRAARPRRAAAPRRPDRHGVRPAGR